MEELTHFYLTPDDSKGKRNSGFKISSIFTSWDNERRSYVATIMFSLTSRTPTSRPFCIDLYSTDTYSLMEMLRQQAKLYKPECKLKVIFPEKGSNEKILATIIK